MELPWGLIGFESLRKAVSIELEGLQPFHWLRFESAVLDATGFVVVDSRYIDPVFPLEIESEDCRLLEVESAADLRVWIVVAFTGEGGPIANLRGPIVGNQRTGVFRQVIPVNASSLPLRHPLNPGF